MPKTHDTKPVVVTKGPLIVSLESLFWHLQRYPRARLVGRRRPLTESARPREVEDPYRKGHGRAFRLPGTRWALVLGYWEPPGSVVLEDEQNERLLEAVEGAHIPGVTATEIATWGRAHDWTRWQLLVRRLRALLGLSTAPPPAREAAADDDALEGWEAETGWSVVPWDDTAVIDFEATRTSPGGSDGVA